MKRLIIALVLGLGLTGFAQETTPPQKKGYSQRMTPEQRQQKHLAHLTKELNLDTKQQEAVGKLLAEKSAKAQNVKTKTHTRKAGGEKLTPEEREALKAKMQAEKTDTEAKMKAILSDEQYKKWLDIREENIENIREKREAMGGEPMGKRTPDDFQQKHLANLTKELNLDTKQQEAVGKLLAEKSAKAKDLKTQAQTQKANGTKLTTEEREALKTKMQAEKIDTETKMKAILSDEQYKKWLDIREENKENMKNKMRNNGRKGWSKE
ncbi:hypothetical protein [Flavobacterium gilvum]|uniref:Uncharacterized protein n=1 Tax=Flavobacterium gilvum TaxID=1492737 RepID=A0AAC9I3J9_9FLAO|nr:hypothetical protein [Flavobacterium gilvum]AOW09395.1 hypothetical protein EM308_07690 [Flavobacterium gilvum]KFC60478.1 hypothetical protein FEM08_07450 [Flavobacterium gilvum]